MHTGIMKPSAEDKALAKAIKVRAYTATLYS
jgi:hypothetical protein